MFWAMVQRSLFSVNHWTLNYGLNPPKQDFEPQTSQFLDFEPLLKPTFKFSHASLNVGSCTSNTELLQHMRKKKGKCFLIVVYFLFVIITHKCLQTSIFYSWTCHKVWFFNNGNVLRDEFMNRRTINKIFWELNN